MRTRLLPFLMLMVLSVFVGFLLALGINAACSSLPHPVTATAR